MYGLRYRARRLSFPSSLVGVVVALLVACPRPAVAQSRESSTFSSQQRFLEEQIRPLIQPELTSAPVDQRFQYDFGGILRYTGLWFQDFGTNVPVPLHNAPDFQASRAT